MHEMKGLAWPAHRTMERLLTAIKASGDPTRLRLIALLNGNELTVSELTEILGQSQPRVSRHLKVLVEAGLVTRFAEGTWAFYRLADNDLAGSLTASLVDLIPDGDETQKIDADRLAAIKRARARTALNYFRKNAREWDAIRTLHTDEAKVEKTILDLFGGSQLGEVLDIGTGTGRMLQVLAPLCERGLGVDISGEMLAVARTNLDEAGVDNCRVQGGTMYSLDLPGESFDTVILHQVLHFADDPGAVLAEAGRVLRPGGRILVVDFAPHKLEHLRTEHAHRRLGFSDTEVAGWLRQSGFKTLRNEHLKGGELTVAIWLAKRHASRARAKGKQAA